MKNTAQFLGTRFCPKTATPDSDGRSRHSRVSLDFRFSRGPDFGPFFDSIFFSGEVFKIMIFLYMTPGGDRQMTLLKPLRAITRCMSENTHTHRPY